MSGLTTDYMGLERSCLYKSHRYRTVDIYVYCPEDDTYYREWTKQRIRVSSTGMTGWWMPYGTYNGRGGVVLKPDPELGKDAWLLNFRQA